MSRVGLQEGALCILCASAGHVPFTCQQLLVGVFAWFSYMIELFLAWLPCACLHYVQPHQVNDFVTDRPQAPQVGAVPDGGCVCQSTVTCRSCVHVLAGGAVDSHRSRPCVLCDLHPLLVGRRQAGMLKQTLDGKPIDHS